MEEMDDRKNEDRCEKIEEEGRKWLGVGKSLK